MPEIWKPVVGYEGRYEVSNLGQVHTISWKRSGIRKPLKATKDTHGYWSVTLYGDGPREHVGVHQLVATAFLGPKPDGFVANHADWNIDNNFATNLEYVTNHENQTHSWASGTRSAARGSRNGAAKLTPYRVRMIKRLSAAGAISHQRIANMMDVGRSAVQRVLYGKTWLHCRKVG